MKFWDWLARCAPYQRPLERSPSPNSVRTLADMSEAEIAALEALYGAPVRRPTPHGRAVTGAGDFTP